MRRVRRPSGRMPRRRQTELDDVEVKKFQTSMAPQSADDIWAAAHQSTVHTDRVVEPARTAADSAIVLSYGPKAHAPERPIPAIAETNPAPNTFRFHASMRPGDIWPMAIRSAVLNILTLTLYRFWSRTEIRGFLWRNMWLANIPFEYRGQVNTLVYGFFVVFVALMLPAVIISFLYAITSLAQIDLPSWPLCIAGAMTPLLFFAASYGADRYRLRHTYWRGVHFDQDGSIWGYALRGAGWFYLSLLTIGMALPFADQALWRYKMKHRGWGPYRMEFTSISPWPLLGMLILSVVVFLLLGVFGVPPITVGAAFTVQTIADQTLAVYAVGALVTMGFAYWFSAAAAVYRLRRLRKLLGATSMAGIRLDLTCGYWAFANNVGLNTTIVLVTLGLGRPFAQMRQMRFWARYLVVTGPLEDLIVQHIEGSPVDGTHEGLADALFMGNI